MLMPQDLDFSVRRTGSITRRNRTGERTDPTKGKEVKRPTQAMDVVSVYQFLIRRQAFPEIAALYRWSKRTEYSTVSKADAKS